MLLARRARAVVNVKEEICGMELPDEVLEKVYHKNAEGIFARFISMAKTKD